MEDLYTVQEFSKLSGVETTTLRYWDDIGLFTPLKRNPENNYRYYSMAQLLALNFVTTLSDLEFPLKTIAELRKERDPESFMNLLDKQEKQMDMEMRRLRQRYSIIHARRELIYYGTKMSEADIQVMTLDDKPIILWPRNEYREGDSFIEPLAFFVKQTGEHRINLSFPVGGYYESMESFMEAPHQPTHFFSIDPVGNSMRKGGEHLVGFTRGYYGEMGDLPERMLAYAKENALNISGPVHTVYLHDEICTQDTSQYLAQSCIAISKSKRQNTRRFNK
ncbi:MAG: MerR family transcriptional regulator [Clostridiales bacterium]|nr:MerR family transcriptional regulator [Clostridiales bacterium]